MKFKCLHLLFVNVNVCILQYKLKKMDNKVMNTVIYRDKDMRTYIYPTNQSNLGNFFKENEKIGIGPSDELTELFVLFNCYETEIERKVYKKGKLIHHKKK